MRKEWHQEAQKVKQMPHAATYLVTLGKVLHPLASSCAKLGYAYLLPTYHTGL